MKRTRVIFLACLTVLAGTAFSSVAGVAAGERRIEIIIDASGSMAGRISGGELKIEAAKRAVSELVTKLPGNTVLAFRAYGHQSLKDKHDCKDTQLLTPFGTLSQGRDRIKTLSQGLQARGYTPITYVLQTAAGDFPAGSPGENVIILVSDGKETCEGDPCALARALVKTDPKLVIHTVGFGVDEAARTQLGCIARAAGGRYFAAEDAAQLIDVLGLAVETSSVKVVEEKGDGWLQIKRADLSGHKITNADTGEEAETASSLRSTVKLPAGIYNVAFGKSIWKSVEVIAGKTTVLEPGFLEVRNAPLHGLDVVEAETGTVHGSVGSLKDNITLIPGSYVVMFGTIPWPIDVKGGVDTTMNPGSVTVKYAHYSGHKIFTKAGELVGTVSNIMDWMPLPPGEYVIEIGKQKIPFGLKEGENLTFERKEE
jgi:hypothetical protein